ncbi:hypothetical protein [uncultured Sphingomonas sp.]|uniref:hypothetical protein n=1 Tax=uncultured Sphingomonas sp. TaxID=158754 RepID=UPI0025E21B58|nr:hypothetical protein [uncultured Sphingomonas sp.]
MDRKWSFANRARGKLRGVKVQKSIALLPCPAKLRIDPVKSLMGSLSMQTETVATTETTKAVWATPAIESYDVAEFTLSTFTTNAGDGINNRS